MKKLGLIILITVIVVSVLTMVFIAKNTLSEKNKKNFGDN